jgi:hypothetical protein
VIDRAEDGDGDAFHPAPSGPVDAERADPPETDSPETDSPETDSRETDDAPARGGRTDAALATPEQRAAASRRYQETVNHTYDVARIEAVDAEPVGAEARDAWAEALPGLRAAWERHEQNYPERARPTPTSQADGGWQADGGRRLSPEQNAEASKACEDIRAEGREVILPAMERVEAADPDRRLAGLEHMLKGEDRLKEKIADEMTAKPELAIGNAVDTVVDPVRFTFTYSQQRYAEGTLSDVERLKSEGFELVKLKNLWTDDQYKGINSQWRRPETGLRFEVQFHTPESLEAKELTHKAYERIRSTASPAERQGLRVYQRQVNALLDTPPGTAEIKDFPEKR